MLPRLKKARKTRQDDLSEDASQQHSDGSLPLVSVEFLMQQNALLGGQLTAQRVRIAALEKNVAAADACAAKATRRSDHLVNSWRKFNCRLLEAFASSSVTSPLVISNAPPTPGTLPDEAVDEQRIQHDNNDSTLGDTASPCGTTSGGEDIIADALDCTVMKDVSVQPCDAVAATTTTTTNGASTTSNNASSDVDTTSSTTTAALQGVSLHSSNCGAEAVAQQQSSAVTTTATNTDEEDSEDTLDTDLKTAQMVIAKIFENIMEPQQMRDDVTILQRQCAAAAHRLKRKSAGDVQLLAKLSATQRERDEAFEESARMRRKVLLLVTKRAAADFNDKNDDEAAAPSTADNNDDLVDKQQPCASKTAAGDHSGDSNKDSTITMLQEKLQGRDEHLKRQSVISQALWSEVHKLRLQVSRWVPLAKTLLETSTLQTFGNQMTQLDADLKAATAEKDRLLVELRRLQALSDSKFDELASEVEAKSEELKKRVEDAEAALAAERKQRESAVMLMDIAVCEAKTLKARIEESEALYAGSQKALATQKLICQQLTKAASSLSEKQKKMKKSRDEVFTLVSKMKIDLLKKDAIISQLRAAPKPEPPFDDTATTIAAVTAAANTSSNDGSSTALNSITGADSEVIQNLRSELEQQAREIDDLEASKKEFEALSARYDVVSAEVEEVSHAFEEQLKECHRMLEVIKERDVELVSKTQENIRDKLSSNNWQQIKTIQEQKIRLLHDHLQSAKKSKDASIDAAQMHSARFIETEAESRKNLAAMAELKTSKETADATVEELQVERRTLRDSLKSFEERCHHAEKRLEEGEAQRIRTRDQMAELRQSTKRLLDESTRAGTSKPADEDDSRQLSSEEVAAIHSENRVLRSMMTCPLCMEKLKDVFLVRCGHSFCQDCLQKSLDSRNRRCPNCKGAYRLPDLKKLYAH